MKRLRALQSVDAATGDLTMMFFCGRCGMPPALALEAPSSRVCGHCGLGLVLQAPADVAPAGDEPFLVVDSTLSVCAVSARAEDLLNTDERHAVDRHVADFLVPADANAPGAENLLVLLVEAASGSGEPQSAVVRPRQEFGVRFRARIGPCGPPRAALLVLTH